MKRNYDKHQKPVRFADGDSVLVWFPNTAPGGTRKFQHQFFGPFTVERKESDLVYTVAWKGGKNGRRKKSIKVHVARLKAFRDASDQPRAPPHKLLLRFPKKLWQQIQPELHKPLEDDMVREDPPASDKRGKGVMTA
jgi:hypothetical protein